ncbi:MAG TPA: hypothetical protein VGD05_07260, partial [Pyrinomonadaceae bacterium]
MKSSKQNFRFSVVLTVFFSLALNVFAAADVAKPKTVSNLDYLLIASNLSEKLKIDLSETNIKIKFGNVEE